ncbi:potassium transporter TrkA [Euryarchaeota archaeon ex4484_178]|nr:MAG: potassium transporter TrkA [Euryarchaeota archaeon ex4484_178]
MENVKDLLMEIKEKSELIVDLAYSSVILDSEDMAKEVEKLEGEIEELTYKIRILTMLAANTPDEAEQLAGILQVADSAKNLANAAADIAYLLDLDISARPFLPSLFLKADEKIHVVRVYPGSTIVNRTLGELNIEAESGVRVIAIKRGRGWIYDPEDNVRIKEGDILIVRGTEDGYHFLDRVARGEESWD